MSKKEELIILVDEIIKKYCQNIRCMQLMIEKGDSIYEGLDVEEAVAIFKKNAEGWLALRRKLDVIKDVTINSCTDEELGISDLIRERDNTKNTAKLAREICQSRYGYYYDYE